MEFIQAAGSPLVSLCDDSMSFPSAKRSRDQDDIPEAPWKSAITDLLTCVSRQDCNSALSSSYRIFNHSNEHTHNEELASGADVALCRLLSFLLLEDSFEDEGRVDAASSAVEDRQAGGVMRVSDEVTRTCQVIEVLYRCTPEALEISFRQVGRNFVRLLSRILAKVPKYREPDDQDIQNMPIPPSNYLKSITTCLRFVTKILCHFVKIQSATLLVAHPRMLSLMILLLQYPVGTISFEVHHNTLWVLANIACCAENMQQMARHDKLLDTVLQFTSTTQQVEEARRVYHYTLRLSAFRCLLNLSWHKQNKTLMSERDDLVEAIRKMVEIRTIPAGGNAPKNDLGARLLQSRIFALGTLRNIAHAPPPQKRRLCTTRNGVLLNLLCDAGRTDEDPSVRDKAFAVIFNLVSTDTAEILITHPRLLGSLVEAASIPANVQSASTMAFRSLNTLDQAASHGPEECRVRVRGAIDQVQRARQYHHMLVPQE